MFGTNMFDNKYDVVLYSVVMDYGQGVYKHNEKSYLRVTYGDYELPLTDPETQDLSWEKYNIPGDPPNDQFLSEFERQFEFIGPTSEERMQSNLEWIRENLGDDTLLIILNGSEVPINNDLEPDRHERHKSMNEVVKDFVNSNQKTELLDVRKYVNSTEDLTNNIRHYKREFHKDFAEEAADLISREFNLNPSVDRIGRWKSLARYRASRVRTWVGAVLGRS
jgi:hypothetical protein